MSNLDPGLFEYVPENDFIDAFNRFGRGANFTVAARERLFEYYNDLAYEIGNMIEFDVIAICGEWSEFEPLELFRYFPELAAGLDVYEAFNYLREAEQEELIEEHELEAEGGGCDLDGFPVSEIIEFHMTEDEVKDFLHDALSETLFDAGCFYVEDEETWLVPSHAGL